MKITLKPKTKPGKWSAGLMIGFFLFLAVFYLFIASGERGGQTLLSNLKLFIPMLIAVTCAIASFFTGIIGIIKGKERSVIVFLTSLTGFLILLWVLAEILFPH